MPPTPRFAICDAIAADIQSKGLGEKSSFLYTEAHFTNLAADLPRLGVWAGPTTLVPMGTATETMPATYERRVVINVDWYVLDKSINERGKYAPDFMLALEETEQALLDAVGWYAAGIPTFSDQLSGTTVSSTTEAVTAGDTGMWRIRIVIEVEELSTSSF